MCFMARTQVYRRTAMRTHGGAEAKLQSHPFADDDGPHAMTSRLIPTTGATQLAGATTVASASPTAGASEHAVTTRRERVLSGMRPTGALHLGHYHGALKNWVRLQHEFECFYFVADWHALTTHYEERGVIEKNVYDMVVDWLAAGIDPDNATLFIQSRLPEHAELFTLLAMGTPLGWLERVPTYKDQMEKLKDRDLATYGFLGYPLLQAADILIYKAAWVPVGEDQSSHVELTREVARRFNHLYGREAELRRAGAQRHQEARARMRPRPSRQRARRSRKKAAMKRCSARGPCSSTRASRSARPTASGSTAGCTAPARRS